MRQAGSLSNGRRQKESLSGRRPCVQAALGSADRRFHLRIVESTGNAVLLHMVTAMWDCVRVGRLPGERSQFAHALPIDMLIGRMRSV
ncbi:FCD domain-containing protein [Burkholderia ubonensis]|uniref:FCD domain-containing protein n=1 Tax=Burkholderia ubonensis TaxID=101571 RepID=UPI0009B4BAE0